MFGPGTTCNDIKGCAYWWCIKEGKCLLNHPNQHTAACEAISMLSFRPKKIKTIKKVFKKIEECHYCGIELTASTFTKDHKKPKSKGGGSGNNLVPACKSCNTRKSDMDYLEFLKLLQREAYFRMSRRNISH